MKKFKLFKNCINFITTTILISCCKNSNAWLPYVVTRFGGLEQFYLVVSRRSPILNRQADLSSHQSDIDVNTKWNIWQNIFVENFQHYDHPFAILLDPSQYETYLRDEYPDIFRELFVERLERPILPRIHALNSLTVPSHPYAFVNASKERTIIIDGVEHIANVFSCLVQEIVSKVVRQYFASRDEYDVNEAAGEDPMAGRFVFSSDAENHRLVMVHSLVEAYPIASIYSPTELRTRYSTRRANNFPADDPDNDPICSLDAGRKVRLCSAVLRLYQIWKKLTLTVRGACEKKRFAFSRSPSYLRPFWDTKFWNAPLDTHEEWMFECVTTPHEQKRVFVSRSYHNNEVFVYENNDTGLLWMTRSTARVGVVHDHAANRRQNDKAGKVDEHSDIGSSTN